MSITDKIKELENKRADDKVQEAKRARQEAAEDKKHFNHARTLINIELRKLNGVQMNRRTLHAKKFGETWRVSTSPSRFLNQADDEAFEVSFGKRHGTFRGSDESPEQEYSDRGIIIKWWRGKSRDGYDEMFGGVKIEIDTPEDRAETFKEFQREIMWHLKHITNSLE